MFSFLPPEPIVPEPQRGIGPLSLRYEDVVQDGRVKLEPITHAVGASLWRRVLLEHPLVQRLTTESILPILSRLEIESDDGPVDVRKTVSTRGTFEWLRCVDPEGRVRVRMDTWGEIVGERGRTQGSAPDGAGESITLGRVLAEHVLTRPFAEPGSRQVAEIPGGMPEGVSLRDGPWSPPSTAMDLPPGAEAIDEGFALDSAPIVFGVGHTDSNQHVNSLVYPRLFEEAVLRRLNALDLGTSLFARYVALGFRKPCFAGDRMRVLVRTFRLGDQLGAVGAFVTSSDALTGSAERAHCFARIVFAA